MEEPIDQGNTRLECLCNGARRVMTLRDAHKMFWEVECAWLLPLDFYRWEIEGHTWQDHIRTSVQARPKFMLRALHRRGHLALTCDDLVDLDPETTELTLGGLITRASRFGKVLFEGLPQHLRPFQLVETYTPSLEVVPGYALRSGCNVMLVVGLAWGSGLRRDEVDWTIFLTPPGRSS